MRATACYVRGFDPALRYANAGYGLLVAAGDGTSTGAGDIVVLDIFGPGEP